MPTHTSKQSPLQLTIMECSLNITARRINTAPITAGGIAAINTEIAKAIGVSKPTISQYLSGRAQPSLVTFARLCNVLDVSADEILCLDKDYDE